VRISAKAEYSVRAAIVLAAAPAGPVKADEISESQGIPVSFLENILTDLRNAGIVNSQRGADGGHWLARPAEEVTLADVIRAVDGPLATVHGLPPEATRYGELAEPLRDVWIALRANIRIVLEQVTLMDVVSGRLPDEIVAAIADVE
jgi:Rrf2 family protein